MPLYRAEAVRFSISGEPSLAGYTDTITTSTDAADWTSLINVAGGVAAGARSLTFDTASGTLAAGNYVLIGSGANAEIRRIASLGTYNGTGATGAIIIDYPTGFFHDDNEAVDERTNASIAGDTFTTFLPGVYETITTPDLTPELLPQYFLRSASDRNWSYIYRGRQVFTGSIANMILLNGYPLRFGIGIVRTTANTVSTTTTVTAAATNAIGSRVLTVTSGVGFANGDLIEISRGQTNPEIRRITSGGGTATFVLNYPMLFAPSTVAGAVALVTGSVFTHTIMETATLGSMTWHLFMRDSGETAANDLIRKHVGGKVNRMTISAEEGGLLRCSWDDVQFIDLVHNQTDHSSVAGTDAVAKSSRGIFNPAGIGGDYPSTGGVLGTPIYPTTEPYYFSQGNITFFGITFARIRDFRLEITNNIEPRYYIRDLATDRTPLEIQEGRREYRFTATIGMEDSLAATATTRTLWKELILEGNYGSGMTGFNVELLFTRGANDTIRIRSPQDQTPSTSFEDQGCFFLRAPHPIGAESPVQVGGEIILRNLEIIVTDNIGVYP
ncbi:MAG: phage tail tube protein [Nanoarchaeota archaeon]